jgi:hypothetical protein
METVAIPAGLPSASAIEQPTGFNLEHFAAMAADDIFGCAKGFLAEKPNQQLLGSAGVITMPEPAHCKSHSFNA